MYCAMRCVKITISPFSLKRMPERNIPTGQKKTQFLYPDTKVCKHLFLFLSFSLFFTMGTWKTRAWLFNTIFKAELTIYIYI